MTIFKKSITNTQLNNWKRPVSPSGTNCVETAFKFLGLIKQDECIASKRATGKELPEITKVLQARSEHNYTFKKIKFENLTELLQPNYMTLGLLNRHKGLGHAVVLAVDSNNKLVLIDPQSNGFTGMDDIKQYLNDNGFKYPSGRYNLMVATSKKRQINNNGVQLRKNKHNHSHKRRKTNKPSTTNTRKYKRKRTQPRAYTAKRHPNHTFKRKRR